MSQSDLVDLAAGLSSGLPNELPFRAAVVAETADDLAAKLRELLGVLASDDSALGKRWAMPRKGVYVGSGGALGRIGFCFRGRARSSCSWRGP